MPPLRAESGRQGGRALIQADFVLYELLQSIASRILRNVPDQWRFLGNQRRDMGIQPI